MSKKVTGTILWTLLGLLLTAAVLVGVGTYFLSPSRLTAIVNRELSRRLDADVTACNVKVSFLKSWPEVQFSIDSVTVRSLVFDSLPAARRKALPADASMLAKAGRISGSINVSALKKHRVELGDIRADRLSVNLVSANDSACNWNILPPKRGKDKIEAVAVRSIVLTRPGAIRYRDLQSGADVAAHPDKMTVTGQGKGAYLASLTFEVDAAVKGRRYLERFPVSLDGPVSLDISRKSVSTHDFVVALGKIRSVIDADMTLGEKPVLNSLRYRLDPMDADTLLKYIPKNLVPALQGLSANLKIGLTARLREPFPIAAAAYPPLDVDFSLGRGNVVYDNPRHGHYNLRDLSMKGRFVMNSRDPLESTLYFPSLSLRDFDTDLTAGGVVRGFGPGSEIEADVKGKLSLAKLGNMMPGLQGFNLEGKVSSDTRIRFRIADMAAGHLERLEVAGKADMRGFSIENIGDVERVSADDMHVDFNAGAADVSRKGASGSVFDFIATADRFAIDAAGCRAEGRQVTLGSNMRDAARISASQLMNMAEDIPFDLRLQAAALSVGSPSDTLRVHVDDADIRAFISARLRNSVKASGYDVSVTGAGMRYTRGLTDMALKGLNTRVRATSRRTPPASAPFRTPAVWTNDMNTVAADRCTPRVIQPEVSSSLSSVMANWKITVDLSGKGGWITSPAFPMKGYVDNLDMTASFDSITMRNLKMHALSSSLSMSATVSNLRQFLTSQSPAPIMAVVRLDADTLELNQLAAAYVRGLDYTYGKGTIDKWLADNTLSRQDSVAILIPRNLIANIYADADNISFGDIDTRGMMGKIHIADGNLEVDTVTLSLPFAGLGMNMRYLTGNIQALRAGMSLRLQDADLDRLLATFPAITGKIPELDALSGNLDADLRMDTRLFPTMFVMLPSATAGLDLHADDLEMKQTRNIRHLAHLLMIYSKGPLHISDMDIHADLRDNLFMLYPFDMKLDKYKLTIAGLNNMRGDMFYHIGIKDWPLAIPFGINLKGSFSHPEFRLGGETLKERDVERIAGDITGGDRKINLSHELWHAFLQMTKAGAEADTTPDSEYLHYSVK